MLFRRISPTTGVIQSSDDNWYGDSRVFWILIRCSVVELTDFYKNLLTYLLHHLGDL
jgi:hypothetical protein